MLEAKTKDQGHKRKSSPKKRVFRKIFQAISRGNRFPKKFLGAPQTFNTQKIVLSSSRGQRNFRGVEVKAKDLNFEAKAKDFKMCPRGQGRPQGLHL